MFCFVSLVSSGDGFLWIVVSLLYLRSEGKDQEAIPVIFWLMKLMELDNEGGGDLDAGPSICLSQIVSSLLTACRVPLMS